MQVIKQVFESEGNPDITLNVGDWLDISANTIFPGKLSIHLLFRYVRCYNVHSTQYCLYVHSRFEYAGLYKCCFAYQCNAVVWSSKEG